MRCIQRCLPKIKATTLVEECPENQMQRKEQWVPFAAGCIASAARRQKESVPSWTQSKNHLCMKTHVVIIKHLIKQLYYKKSKRL